MQERHQVLNLIRLQRIAEGRHTAAALTDLLFDPHRCESLADGAQVRSALGSARIRAMAELTAALME